MARRIRSLKPEIVDDEKTGPLSDTAWRLFTSMIVMADDFGNVRADVRWLQSQIWWAHENPPNVLKALVELSRAGLVRPYGVRGGTYVNLTGWFKHQRIDNASKGHQNPKPDDPQAVDISIADPESPLAPRNDDVKEDVQTSRGESPRTAASRGSDLDLDLERDLDVEGEREGDAAAKPRARPRRPKAAQVALPSDWSPRSQEREKAVALGLDIERELVRFRNHHEAKGSRMADWNAALRTWLDNSAEWGVGRKPATTNQTEIRRIEEM